MNNLLFEAAKKIEAIENLVNHQNETVSRLTHLIAKLEKRSTIAERVCLELFRYPKFLGDHPEIETLLKNWEGTIQA